MDFTFVCHKLTNVRESAMLDANELLSMAFLRRSCYVLQSIIRFFFQQNKTA